MYFIPPPTSVDGTSLTQSAAGVISAKDGGLAGVKLATAIDRWASGSSSSGTPGTAIASLTATAGNRLTALAIVGSGAASANTFVRVVVTYADDTTTTVDSTGTGFNLVGNRAAIGYAAGATGVWQMTALDTSKAIKDVTATTLGAGVGARLVGISATEAKLA